MTPENSTTPEAELDAALDALANVADPEVDAAVEDALEIDSIDEADAAATAIVDEESLEEGEEDAEAESR